MKALETFISPPNIVAMICGVQYARISANGTVTLHYTDGTTESARLTLESLAEGRDNFFSLVGSVQSFRKPSIP